MTFQDCKKLYFKINKKKITCDSEKVQNIIKFSLFNKNKLIFEKQSKKRKLMPFMVRFKSMLLLHGFSKVHRVVKVHKC